MGLLGLLVDERRRAGNRVVTRYGSVVKLQETRQALATPVGPYTTSPAREIVMPAKRSTAAPCPTCGTPVLSTPAMRATGRGRYCSPACSATGRSKPREAFTCEHCGMRFEPYPSAAARRRIRFCSNPCAFAYRRANGIGGKVESARQRKARNRAYIAEVNARTACAHCGSQPVEWHNPEHVELNRGRFRIGNLASSTASLDTIRAEMDRCTPLCRRCHMAEDGRLERLRQETIERNKAVIR